ncbi:hypothetical protein MNEG_4271 [Monoraphidium neglectum]|uniref:Phosphatidic acid phosphatase type 2/haloperoxidase domain-containing protein n=1 Tax=Monoraphidium neglectum TaxID=145388 RepID=A0A0D2NEV3_9CHLO|nr:hypothetical protein MNEG_4271 [Monoraphidium neglectum]KIZ03686.1 hypothetical protein MNEG_4271 [Monoraphidium neglectum]|eukprot:XP_013902705.1 hypothetical protein MNEG_4271 [Monoraphidium neglectum]
MWRSQTLIVALAACLMAVAPAQAILNNTVTQWEAQAQQAVRSIGIQNQLSNRLYGLVALAQLHAIEKLSTLDPVIAAGGAGHAVLSILFPSNQSAEYDGLLKKQLDAATGGKALTDAQKAGLKAAAALAGDLVRNHTGGASAEYSGFKFGAPGPFVYQLAPGQKYALYPQLGNAKPFVVPQPELSAIVTNTDAAKGPVFKVPPISDYETARKLGANTTDKALGETALFWADGANTSAISGHWLDIAKRVLPSTLSVKDSALFFAKAFTGAWDASIAAWKIKYSTLHWRPVTAFRAGYTGPDGPVAADKEWTGFLTRTPPHPEYPSGHQATVGALLEALVRQLGTDKVEFSIGSEGTPFLPERKYTDLTTPAVEVGDSRLYGGVHFNTSNVDGLIVGRVVASKAWDSPFWNTKAAASAPAKASTPAAKPSAPKAGSPKPSAPKAGASPKPDAAKPAAPTDKPAATKP